ncbi:hypothetical protein HOLleu_35213 [Holothuria leucospilota]|uniref:Uncharacterized protein n=1 Tax=Holothuria leucospilota TaxID=206669 RepID=A0A9Q1BFY1_HOLLE|nr:hypothetical protein HOLleu_35213 [Holothuria leucospilota]
MYARTSIMEGRGKCPSIPFRRLKTKCTCNATLFITIKALSPSPLLGIYITDTEVFTSCQDIFITEDLSLTANVRPCS